MSLLPLQHFVVLWGYFFLFLNLKNIYIFLFYSLLFFSCCSYFLIYINLLNIILFNFAFLLFLSFILFLFFTMFVSFVGFFVCLFLFCFCFCFIPQLALCLVLFSSLCFSYFCFSSISFLVFFACQIAFVLFLCTIFGFVCVYVPECMWIPLFFVIFLILYLRLPGVHLYFLFCTFILTPFNDITNDL